jgi:serine/threonine protein kinase
MPIGITAKGGPDFMQNVGGLGENAYKTLEKIQGHLAAGRNSGVLTLVNRTKNQELQLVRKNRFQLMFRGDKNQRLEDTSNALKNLLSAAGLHAASNELDRYLKEKPGGEHNRVSSKKMLEILNTHLGRKDSQEPLGRELSDAGLHQSELAQRLGHELEDESEDLGMNQAPAGLTDAHASDATHRLISGDAGENQPDDPFMTSNTQDALRVKAGIKIGALLGAGNFGMAYECTVGGDPTPRVLKFFGFGKPQILSLYRSGMSNEAFGAYLTSEKTPGYAQKAGVAQPEFFLIEVGGEHKLMRPTELRQLIKTSPKDSVKCFSIVLPKAEGGEITELIDSPDSKDKKNAARGVLSSVAVLNQRGFVHRDIKPANAFFDADTGKSTLIDTGLMQKLSKNKPKLQFLNHAAGTPLYLHPRAWRERFGTEVDLYASAIMMLELDQPSSVFDKILAPIADELRNAHKLGLTDPLGKPVGRQLLNERIDEAVKKTSWLSAERKSLQNFKKAINDPTTLSGFAMRCLDYANRPADQWAKRDQAQQWYGELLSDPALS